MASSAGSLRRIATDVARLLSFRRPSSAIATHWQTYLTCGLYFTWLAGIGRYWDNPRASLWQHLGLGSVAYVFLLSALLWVVLWPLRAERTPYRTILVFVTLTSPPALLYALPVERWVSLATAQAANAWFLALVATWRIGLLIHFFRRVAKLSHFATLVTALLPLTAIVTALALLNLEHVVFEIMSGNEHLNRSPNDTAFLVVALVAYFSFYATPFLLAAYGWLVYERRHQRRAGGTATWPEP